MKATEPAVFLIAEPHLLTGIHDYLSTVGGVDWLNRVNASDPEMLVEFAGRACYRSWEPGLNLNVTKVRQDSSAYIANLMSSRHGSVLEHAQLTFVLSQVSRVFTHELVRHRVGVAISQESGRYVRLGEISIWMPPVIVGQPELAQRWVSIVESVEEWQRDASDVFGLDTGLVPFDTKKQITSAIRRLSPFGHSSEMVWSANIRTIRHVLEQRTALGAEEEMRLVYGQVGNIVKARYPMLFQDYDVSEAGEWKTKNIKV